jgi:replicative DNA helicase
LLDPKNVIPEMIERLKGEGEEFYDLRHLTIWQALVTMYDQGTAIDVITLQAYLKKQEMLEQVGGLGYLAALPDSVPSAANLSYYLDILCEKYVLRKTVQVCTDVVERVYNYEGEVDALMDEVERDMIRIREVRSTETTPDIKALVGQSIQEIENLYERRGLITGVATGFVDFDRMTSGLQPGEVFVIAARPGLGKTSCSMNIAEFVALELKLGVGVFSLEMTAKSLVLRMLCSRARVNLRSVREGFLAERDFPKLTGAAGRLSSAPLYIDDSSGLSVMQLRAKVRRMVARWGIKIAIVDYLQLLDSTSRRAKNRQEEIADISKGIKALSKELGIPIILLSQLNREVERDKARKPRMADLRESGAIEQDADLVGLLYQPYRDENDGVTWEQMDAVPTNMLIAKNRNGPTGDVNLTFLKQFTRFESAARISDMDVPEQTEIAYSP